MTCRSSIWGDWCKVQARLEHCERELSTKQEGSSIDHAQLRHELQVLLFMVVVPITCYARDPPPPAAFEALHVPIRNGKVVVHLITRGWTIPPVDQTQIRYGYYIWDS
jgi:hypothetical protein